MSFAYSSEYLQFEERVDDAYKKCLNTQSLPKVVVQKASREMYEHFVPSRLQGVLTPIYTTYVDDFGGVVQSLLGDDEMAYVLPYLEFMGKRLKRFALNNNLGKLQTTCIAGCMVQRLMDPEDSINPYTSMALAVYRGKGFCRHYSLAAKKILKNAGISSEMGTSIDHAFLYLTNMGQKLIYDSMNTDGLYECVYHPYISK